MYQNISNSHTGQRADKEGILHQHARVIWMCGLSGSGKSTLANALDMELTQRGYLCQVIDGDVIRKGLNKGLGFSVDDREENIRRVAEVARLFVDCGVIAIVSFISPTASIRSMAKNIVGETDFIEIFINAPLSVCEERDTKGLYRKAREGKISEFTGIDSPFEPPENPANIIDTFSQTIQESTTDLLNYILPIIAYS